MHSEQQGPKRRSPAEDQHQLIENIRITEEIFMHLSATGRRECRVNCILELAHPFSLTPLPCYREPHEVSTLLATTTPLRTKADAIV